MAGPRSIDSSVAGSLRSAESDSATGFSFQLLLGRELEHRDQLAAALQCYEKESHWQALVAAGAVLYKMGRTEQAVARFRRALRQQPSNSGIHCHLANCWGRLGSPQKMVRHFRNALAIAPGDSATHSRLLAALHFDSRLAPEAIFAEHLAWADRHAPPADSPVRHRPLIGYVSPYFYGPNPVANFIPPVLEAHQMPVTCYASHDRPAEAPSLRWRNISSWDDARLFEQIRNDGIGILVDLTGHFAGNRLRVFARKPAPVQITWIGYPNTTGLRAMDYRLTDAIADPPGLTGHLHSETLIRLPGCFLCYRPPDSAPRVNRLPTLSGEPFTFGCFNRLTKITSDVVRLWARILEAVPRSRLLLHHGQGAYSAENPANRRALLARFAKCGISPERILLEPFVASEAEHLELYHRVDLALDTFPYNGTTTTCEALWMGVPVVTLAGATHVARVGASLLHAVGLSSWAAASADAYSRLAIQAAGDTSNLSRLRRSLRPLLARSPLLDASGFTCRLENVFQSIWLATAPAAASPKRSPSFRPD